MASSKKTATPAAQRDQESTVRSRAAERRASSSELSIFRDVRFEEKLARARQLLGELPPTDDRGRMLHIAVLRRDEALLDGILSMLDDPPLT